MVYSELGNCTETSPGGTHGFGFKTNVLFNNALNTFLIRLYGVGCFGFILEGRKEGNVLFNEALNTFSLRLYGVRPVVKDHSDNERGNPTWTTLSN